MNSNVEQNVVLQSIEDTESKIKFKENRYKIFAYPIIFIVGYVLMNLCMYTFVPYINMSGLMIIGDNIADILVYFPTYLCIDGCLCVFSWWLCKKFAKYLISFVQRQIEKYDAKQARREARFGPKKKKGRKTKTTKEMSE